jgi:hypothetical protein
MMQNTTKELFLASIEENRLKSVAARLEKQLKLPMWPDNQRAMPNGPLRSCLFSATDIRHAKKPRRIYNRELIATTGNDSILYTGVQLDQNHFTLWDTLLHFARKQNLGDRCQVTVYELLSAIGKKGKGASSYETLLMRLAQLSATSVEIKQGIYSYTGSLVDEAFRDDKTGLVTIVLNRRLIALFQPDQFTRFSWDVRRSLKRPLAMWLHGYYSSHANPFDVSIEFIKNLSGSETKSIKDFKNKLLIPSLNELSEVSAKHGECFDWMFTDNGLVRVKRSKTKRLF